MYSMYWIYCMTLISIGLLSMVQANKTFFIISKFKFGVITYNESKILFCKTDSALPCVDQIYLQIDYRALSISTDTGVSDFEIQPDGPCQISSDVYIRLSDANTTVKSSQMVSLNFNTTQIPLEFTPNVLAGSVSLSVKCQTGYLSPGCSDTNLCPKVPADICRNNGSCFQDKGNIQCKCNPGFKGNFCDEPVSPCQKNLCSKDSSCKPDSLGKLRYRCECNPGYTGVLCNELKDPCQGNLCLKDSTCRRDNNEILRYKCECKDGYTGRFCDLDVDNCEKNQSLCSHFINATCISRRGGFLCHCDGACITPSSGSESLPFKWPFSDLITLLFVVLEGVVIFTLIILIVIMKSRCCETKKKRSKKHLAENLLLFNGSSNNREGLEFGTNYTTRPIIMDDIDTSRSINPLYDINDVPSFSNNHLGLEAPGMSTFGRR